MNLAGRTEVSAAIKGLKMGKAAGPTGVVSEMMKAAGGFGSRWMTDLINNIVNVCGSYRVIRLLEQPVRVIGSVGEEDQMSGVN